MTRSDLSVPHAVLACILCVWVFLATVLASDDEGSVEILRPATSTPVTDAAVRTPLAVLEPVSSLDLGVIKTRQFVTRQVRITNTAGRPIRVEVQRVTCSCVGVTLDDEEIAPGEFTDLWIELAVLQPEASGVYRHRIFLGISTADEGEARSADVSLDVRYEHRRTFALEPGDTYPLRYSCCAGERIQRVVALINYAGGSVRPTGATVRDIEGWRVVSIDQKDSWRGGEVWWVTLEGAWDDAGKHQGSVTVHTSDELVPEWSVSLVGDVHPPVATKPSARLVAVGDAAEFEIGICGPWKLGGISVREVPDGVSVIAADDLLKLRGERPGSYRVPVVVRLVDSEREIEREWEISVRLIVRSITQN